MRQEQAEPRGRNWIPGAPFVFGGVALSVSSVNDSFRLWEPINSSSVFNILDHFKSLEPKVSWMVHSRARKELDRGAGELACLGRHSGYDFDDACQLT